MSKQKILLLKGLPASGKSFFAKELCDNNISYRRINKDDLRRQIANYEFSNKVEKEILDKERNIGIKYLNEGFNLVVDDTNLHPKHEQFWKEVAERNNYDFEIKFFNVAIDICIDRDNKRAENERVGAEVIKNMYNRYIKPTLINKEKRFILEQNTELPRCIICDIDGTLALIDKRNVYDESNVDTDKVNIQVADILRNYSFLYKENGVDGHIILFSGRHNGCRELTTKWLNDNNIPFDQLHMRSDDDNRKDNIIKMELYEKYIKDRYYVEFVLDDRNSVVDMWRELGLLCLQVYYGDF